MNTKSHKEKLSNDAEIKAKIPKTSWTSAETFNTTDMLKHIKMKVNKACEEKKTKGEKTFAKTLPVKSVTNFASTKNVQDISRQKGAAVKTFNDGINCKVKSDSKGENVKLPKCDDLTKKRVLPKSSSVKLHSVNAGRLHFSKDFETTYKPHRRRERKPTVNNAAYVNAANSRVVIEKHKYEEPVKAREIVWKRKMQHVTKENENVVKNPQHFVKQAKIHSMEQISKNSNINSEKCSSKSKSVQRSEYLAKAISNELDKCKSDKVSKPKMKSVLSTSSESSSSCRSLTRQRMHNLDRMASDLCKIVQSSTNDHHMLPLSPKCITNNAKLSPQLEEHSIDKIVDKISTILNKDSVKVANLHKVKIDTDIKKIGNGKMAFRKDFPISIQPAPEQHCDPFVKNVVDKLAVFYRREEVTAAIIIQAAFRGYKVRKITKELLRTKGFRRAGSEVKSVGCFYRSSQLDKADGSLQICESYYKFNHCKLPKYVKPLLTLTENNNINDFLQSSFSLSGSKVCSKKPPEDIRESNDVPCSNSYRCHAKITTKSKVSSVETIDLLRLEKRKVVKAHHVSPVETNLQHFATMDSVSVLPSSSTENYSRKDTDSSSREESSLKSNGSFLPHRVKCLAASDLSQRVNAELLYQDTVSLALGHLKELENLNNTLIGEINLIPFEAGSNFSRNVQDRHNFSNVFDSDFKKHSSSVEKEENFSMQLEETPIQFLNYTENEKKTNFFPATNTVNDFDKKVFSTGNKLPIGSYSLPSEAVKVNIEMDSLSKETLLETKPCSIPTELGHDCPSASSTSQLEYTIELIPSVKKINPSPSVVVKRINDKKLIANTIGTIPSRTNREEIFSDDVSLEIKTLDGSLGASFQTEESSEKSLDLISFDNNSKGRSSYGLLNNSLKKLGKIKDSADALQSTLNVVISMQNEEKVRADHQIALLNLQEHSLIQEAKAELENIQNDGGQNVRRRQRDVWHQLKIQLSHIRCLIKTQTVAAEQKRLMYWQYLQLLESSGKSNQISPLSDNFLKSGDRADTPHPRQQVFHSTLINTDDSFDSTSNPDSFSVQLNNNAKCLPKQKELVQNTYIPETDLPSLETAIVSGPNIAISGLTQNVSDGNKDSEYKIKRPVSIPHIVQQTGEQSRLQIYNNEKQLSERSSSKVTVEHRQRRRLPASLKLSLSPKPHFNHSRRHSSESDDSFTLSQNETASDISDGERRLLTLKDELSVVKAEAERLFKEKKRIRRERTASQELALQKQIAAYNSYITRTKLEVEEENQTREFCGKKPLIKKRNATNEKLHNSIEKSNSLEVKDLDTVKAFPNLAADSSEKDSVQEISFHLGDTHCEESGHAEDQINDDVCSSIQPASQTHFSPDNFDDNSQLPKQNLDSNKEISSLKGDDHVLHQQCHSVDRLETDSDSENPKQIPIINNEVETRNKLIVPKRNLKPLADQISNSLYNQLLAECTQNMFEIFIRKGKIVSINEIASGSTFIAVDNGRSSSQNYEEIPRLDGSANKHFAKFENLDEIKSPDGVQSHPQNSFNPEELSDRLLKMDLWCEEESPKSLAPLQEDFAVRGHEGSWFDTPFWQTDRALYKDQNKEVAYIELQKLKELFPDLVLREVPNKPPPPYTPPKNASPPTDKMVFVSNFEVPSVDRPHKTTTLRQPRSLGIKTESVIKSEADKWVRHIVEHLHLLWKSGTSFQNIQFESHIFRNGKVEEASDDIFHRLLFDLCKLYFREGFNKSSISPTNDLSLCVKYVEHQIRGLLNQHTSGKKETFLTRWTKTKQDKVGRLIIEGILAEEHHWVNVCDPTIAQRVKDHISDDIFSSLLDDTISAFDKILCSKLGKANLSM